MNLFYHPQLMEDESQVRLFCLMNPTPFTSFEDHEAAMLVALHDLVLSDSDLSDTDEYEEIKRKIKLVELYLGVTYNGCNTIAGLATWLWGSEYMLYARSYLKDRWDQMNPEIEEDSLLYEGMSGEEVRDIYTSITFETYLEALVRLYP